MLPHGSRPSVFGELAFVIAHEPRLRDDAVPPPYAQRIWQSAGPPPLLHMFLIGWHASGETLIIITRDGQIEPVYLRLYEDVARAQADSVALQRETGDLLPCRLELYVGKLGAWTVRVVQRAAHHEMQVVRGEGLIPATTICRSRGHATTLANQWMDARHFTPEHVEIIPGCDA